jgi:hypothetical protein
MAEEIDIGSFEDLSVIDIGKPSSKSYKPSVNFGGGVELLMNTSRKNDGSKTPTDIDLDDITELEEELNGLANENKTIKTEPKSRLFGNNTTTSSDLNEIKLNIEEVDFDNDYKNSSSFGNSNGPTIGVATSNAFNNEKKTWDGFGKFNNIPVDPDREYPDKPKLSNEDLLREKFKVLRKLEAIERKGATLTKKYSMDSSLDEMQGEYEMIIAEKEKSNSCKFQGRMLMAAVTGLEFLNNRFDPFDIKIDGWSEQLNENIDDYDEIFAELHEKYKSKAKMAPELKLLFQLGGSAIMVHMTNTMFKSAMPGMDDIMRQNPELMQQFTQAAVNSMSETKPGFSGFMNNIMSNGGGGSGNVGNTRAPPPPVQTQSVRSQRAATAPNNRPDMSHARGGNGGSIQDGINISQQYGNASGYEPAEKSTRQQRPEMKGPSDISDLLSGLKTKTINIPQQQPPQQMQQQQQQQSFQSAPQVKPKRKQKSDKSTLSLDI